MTTIGVISDTHGVLKDSCKEILSSCDYIIHAGDIGSERCFQELKNLGPHFYFVKGNCDKGIWTKYLPETLGFPIEKLTFYLIHNRQHLSSSYPESDVVITGHTHVCQIYEDHGVTYINPGSCSKSRCGLYPTMVRMQVDGYKIQYERIELRT